MHLVFNRGFDAFLGWYRKNLNWALHHKGWVLGGYALLCAGTAFLLPYIGADFFPSVDAGSFRLHVRAPAGTFQHGINCCFTRFTSASSSLAVN